MNKVYPGCHIRICIAVMKPGCFLKTELSFLIYFYHGNRLNQNMSFQAVILLTKYSYESVCDKDVLNHFVNSKLKLPKVTNSLKKVEYWKKLQIKPKKSPDSNHQPWYIWQVQYTPFVWHVCTFTRRWICWGTEWSSRRRRLSLWFGHQRRHTYCGEILLTVPTKLPA